MKIKIYQINSERDEQRASFQNFERMNRYGIKFDSSVYDCVYDGNVDAEGLEDVFYIFNIGDIDRIENPASFRGHSLSVSDVVEVDGKFFFCDSFGWKEIPFEQQEK